LKLRPVKAGAVQAMWASKHNITPSTGELIITDA